MTPQDSLILAQSAIDVVAWLLMPFAVIIAIEWAVGLFRRG